MSLRSWLRRVERAAHGEVESFELRDGSRYWFDPLEVAKELFLHSLDCGRVGSLEEWPELPEVYLKMCEAKDPKAVLERFVPSDKEAWFIELLSMERDGVVRPSGHFRRGELGEAPYSKNRPLYTP